MKDLKQMTLKLTPQQMAWVDRVAREKYEGNRSMLIRRLIEEARAVEREERFRVQ